MTESPSLVRPPGVEELVVDDAEPMESARHRQQMVLLIESLEYGWRERNDFYVGGNMFFYYSEAQTRKNDFRGPDVFVVLGTERRERKAWVVWLEGGKTPDVIVELTSESTATIDHRDKKALYQRLKIGEYFIFDPFSQKLDGWELDRASRVYRPKAHDAKGRLRSELLGLDLGTVTSTLWSVQAPWLRWIDASGVPLPFPYETALAAEAKAERAEANAERAEANAERAEAKAKRAEAKAKRAEDEAKRAEDEAKRAEDKAARAEARLAEYERKFGPLGR